MLEKLTEEFGNIALGSMTEAPMKIKVEPWMADFIKERHTQEEWDWFFWYQTATPFQRFASAVTTVVCSMFEPGRWFPR